MKKTPTFFSDPVKDVKQKFKFEESPKEELQSEWNILTFFLATLATLGMLGIWSMYYDSSDWTDVVWSEYAFRMFLFGLTGIIAVNLYKNKRFQIMSQYYKPLRSENLFIALLVFGVLVAIQTVMNLMDAYLSPANIVQIAYTIFSAVCEELFYRGLILGFFIWLSKGKYKSVMFIGILISTGLMFSAFAFAASHTNYYGNWTLLIAVFLSGLVLGLSYVLTKDLMVPIIGHFLLNCYVVLMPHIQQLLDVVGGA